jgi:hypothetical protein
MLNDNQIAALLAVAGGYDNRRPGELNVASWSEASKRGRWTFDAAVEAIHAYYNENREWIMPADITKRIKDSQGHPPRYVALPPAEPASDETRSRIMAMIGNRFSLPRGRS